MNEFGRAESGIVLVVVGLIVYRGFQYIPVRLSGLHFKNS